MLTFSFVFFFLNGNCSICFLFIFLR